MAKWSKSHIPTVKIYNDDADHPMRTLIEIDGHKIRGVREITYNVSTDTVPEFALQTVGIPDITIDRAFVRLDSSPKTVNEAARILKEALVSDRFLYDAWVSSIAAAIDNCHEVTIHGVSRAIVDWLIGDDFITMDASED